MENLPLRKLTVSIENENKEDVVIIFTEPLLKVNRCYILLLFDRCKFLCFISPKK
jgi:hypothetical protein